MSPAASAPPGGTARSQDFLDDVHWTLIADLADADCEEPVQKRILRRRRLETGQRAEVFVPVVPYAGEGHVYQRAIICLQGDPQVDLNDAVGPRGDPVAAAGEHAAAKTAVERASPDGKDRQRASSGCADVLGGGRVEAQRHEMTWTHARFLFLVLSRRCDEWAHKHWG